jgi:hypothetical protein
MMCIADRYEDYHVRNIDVTSYVMLIAISS